MIFVNFIPKSSTANVKIVFVIFLPQPWSISDWVVTTRFKMID